MAVEARGVIEEVLGILEGRMPAGQGGGGAEGP
jgi:hypothetical protein